MEQIAQIIGLTAAELTQLVILAGVLLVGLFVLRIMLKLTAALMRIGCIGIVLIVAAVFLVQLLSN